MNFESLESDGPRISDNLDSALSDIEELAKIYARRFPSRALSDAESHQIMGAMTDAYIAGMCNPFTKIQRAYLEHLLANEVTSGRAKSLGADQVAIDLLESLRGKDG
jgi:hypothetical protein